MHVGQQEIVVVGTVAVVVERVRIIFGDVLMVIPRRCVLLWTRYRARRS